MKSILSFLRTTLTGGVLFFLPLVFIMIAVKHGVETLRSVLGPLAIRLGIENVAGKATITLLVVLVIILICFIGGLLARLPQLKKLNEFVENNLMVFIPGYDQFKTQARDKIGASEKTPVLLFDQKIWVPALKIEMGDGFSTYFVPSDSEMKRGSVRIWPIETVQEKVITHKQLKDLLESQGKGAATLLGN
jgi:hypothetical protein